MKEAKPKPIAKLTPIQLTNVRSLNMQINTLGKALEGVFFKKQEFLEEVRSTYKLATLDFYIDLKTGEVLELWPEI